MSALVYQLTDSPLAVGAVTAVLRFGWLAPQLFVGFLAERRASSMRYYAVGGYGRATCLLALAVTLFAGSGWGNAMLATAVLVLWTAYAFVSGIVAVPYNDIVARSVASERRSRLLATRFLGGGVLALGLAAFADALLGLLPFPRSYAALIALASGLMLVSATVFVLMGERAGSRADRASTTFTGYLREGVRTLRIDRRFRLLVSAQWCGGAVLMALPFYVVQAAESGFAMADVAWLLGAQTAGALASNPLWGWWGDRLGKSSLLGAVALARMVPPAVILLSLALAELTAPVLFAGYVAVFFVLGALANGLTIAVIGYLMEISPDDRRPSYSGYFNALTAPAFLFPLLGGVISSLTDLWVVFAFSLAAAAGQRVLVARAAEVGPTPARAGDRDRKTAR
jgi:MFS family permease